MEGLKLGKLDWKMRRVATIVLALLICGAGCGDTDEGSVAQNSPEDVGVGDTSAPPTDDAEPDTSPRDEDIGNGLEPEAENEPEAPEDAGADVDPDPDQDVGDEVQRGYRSLFIGHSFFAPVARKMATFAPFAGLEDHTQAVVFSGGASGTPLSLWQNDAKRQEIQTILDTGEVELFGMTCCSEGLFSSTDDGFVYNGPDVGITQWMDYALSKNPQTRFALALPWPDFPEDYANASEYAQLWHTAHALWHLLVDDLRELYPETEIFCIPHGQAALELRALFEAGELPDVTVMLSGDSASIFNDNKGHADDILLDLAALVWISSIYGVDLSLFDERSPYEVDLIGVAEGILEGHRDQFP